MRRQALTIIILLILIGLLSALAGVLFGLVKLPEFITSYPLVALLVVGVALGGLGYWLYRVQSPAEMPRLRKQDRQRMLARVRTRITKQLADTLQGAIRVELGLHEQPNAIIDFSPFSLQQPEQPAQPMPSQTRILQAYQEAEDQLLILGEPGGGKTTLLLELSRDLLEQAEQDESVPIPIIFNLASWATKRQPLGDWMVEELERSYQVSKTVGQPWIEADEIQPLLDGLDEVAEAQRAACVEAINTYREQHGLLPTVVCSRKDDYFNQPRRLRLQGAVVVEPLSQPQIDALLSSVGASVAGLRQALATEPSLQALAPIPLMLNLMILAYQGLPAAEIMQPSSLSTRQQRVLADYVQRRLRRRGAGARYTAEQTLGWLGWLAGQMSQRNGKEFQLSMLHPFWLSRRQMVPYRWSFGLFSGLITGLACGLAAGLNLGLVFGLVFGLAFGLAFFGLICIAPPPGQDASGCESQLPWGGVYWLTYTLSFGLLLGQTAGPHFGLIGGLIAGVSGALVGGFTSFWCGLFGSLLGLMADNPEDMGIEWGKIRELVALSFFTTLGGWLLFGLITGIVAGLAGGLAAGLSSGLLTGLFYGLILGLVCGGLVVLRHYVLRFFLWRARCVPWRYPRFLDYAVECMLLRKVGDSYIFIHQLLQDYFAALDAKRVSP